MSESKDIPPLLSSKRALKVQLWVSAIACLYPSMFVLSALVFQPHQTDLSDGRIPLALEIVIPPFLLVATIRALHGHTWATVLSVIGQLSITCLLSREAIAVAHEPGSSLVAVIVLCILLPAALLSACLSLWHLIATYKFYFSSNDRNA